MDIVNVQKATLNHIYRSIPVDNIESRKVLVNMASQITRGKVLSSSQMKYVYDLYFNRNK